MSIAARTLGADDWSAGYGADVTGEETPESASRSTVDAIDSITDTLNRAAETITDLAKPKAGIKASSGGTAEMPPDYPSGTAAGTKLTAGGFVLGALLVAGAAGGVIYFFTRKKHRRR